MPNFVWAIVVFGIALLGVLIASLAFTGRVTLPKLDIGSTSQESPHAPAARTTAVSASVNGVRDAVLEVVANSTQTVITLRAESAGVPSQRGPFGPTFFTASDGTRMPLRRALIDRTDPRLMALYFDPLPAGTSAKSLDISSMFMGTENAQVQGPWHIDLASQPTESGQSK